MDATLLKICCYIMMIGNFPGHAFGVKLGETCQSHQECETEFSKCHQETGTCSCLPYYARVNNTCLQSSLLGFECVVDEQCSLKVANSRCHNNFCVCESHFWQYRRHTCLPPAKPGDVCYSDAHCALWDVKTKCAFTIPGVFGFCVCDSGSGRADCPSVAGQDPSSALFRPNNSAFKYPFSRPDPKKKVPPYQKRTTTTTTVKPFRPAPQVLPFKRPVFRPNPTNNNASKAVPAIGGAQTPLAALPLGSEETTAVQVTPTNVTAFERPQPPVPLKFFSKSPVKGAQMHNKNRTVVDKTSAKVHKKPIDGISGITTLRKGDPKRRLSLGFPCVSDAQCMRSDENSRCLHGICDCRPSNKTNDQCSAKLRGCLHNTFQCRSSGKCISWFFVCDGRTGDCGEDDHSDEECIGNQLQCPNTAFACRAGNGVKNLCVSRSTRCDGVKNCPLGDDEEGCNANGHKGCPAYTFQCGDGQCLPEYELCNAVVTCADKSDELEGLCGGGAPVIVGGNSTAAAARTPAYPPAQPPPLTRVRGAYRHATAECPFRCRNGRCRSTAVLCSGRDGCGDGSDESGCSVCKCPVIL